MTGVSHPGDQAARLASLRSAIVKRGAEVEALPSVRVSAVLAQALADRGGSSRELRALHNRDQVERMSRTGAPVAEIAVALRAQLGVGRRR